MRPLPMAVDIREYDEERGRWILAEYGGRARNDKGRLMTLQELHDSDPGNIPEPGIILRWARENIRFRAALREAERARARVLVEETIEIADDTTRSAAHARNAIDARFRLAEAFDRAMFAPPSGGGLARDPLADEGEGTNGERLENMDEGALVALIERERARQERPAMIEVESRPGTGGQGGAARIGGVLGSAVEPHRSATDSSPQDSENSEGGSN
jgi:hypothetical protein